MRLYKIIIPALLVIVFTSSCVSTTRVRVTPRKHVIVTKLNNPYIVKHRNVTYYHSKGKWYRKNNHTYVAVSPPNGVVIRKLPYGYKTVVIKKQRYYTYNGIYYKKRGSNFVVVNI